jgi:predicted transcriptional regulator
MSNVERLADRRLPPEPEAARKIRVEREAELIAEGDADFEAGRFVDSADVKDWIDSIGTEHELPPPRPRR